MFSLFENLKQFIVGIMVTVSTVTAPVVQTAVPTLTPSISPSVPPVSVSSAPSVPSPTPLTLNNENYIYVKGNYSYFGMNFKYLFLVPKNGGNFSGSVEGTCTAQANGDYEGGNGGKISGNASGECKIFGMKYKGSAKYKGNLYPESKKVTVEIDDSPIKGPFTLNYN